MKILSNCASFADVTQPCKAIFDVIVHPLVANVEQNSKITVYKEMGIKSKLPN